MASLQAKVVILGSEGVGKTSFMSRYIKHMFSDHPSPTIGASFLSCDVTVDGYTMKLYIWDTAGQERFRAMAPMYYRGADAAILMFDLCSRKSYEDMKSWIEELNMKAEQPILICIVGNKSDMRPIQAVQTKESSSYAVSIGALYHETSALSSEGVEAVFIDIARELIHQQLQLSHASSVSMQNRIFSRRSIIHVCDQKLKDKKEKSFLCC